MSHQLSSVYPAIVSSVFVKDVGLSVELHMGWKLSRFPFTSVQFSCSVVSNSLWPHELQHAGPSCPSPTARVYPNPCWLTWWCHPTISSSVIPFSSYPQSSPALGSFQMSQLFSSGGQSFGVLASTSVLPMNTQDWSLLGWTGWISCSAFFIFQLSHTYMTTGKTIALTRRTFDDKVMSLLLNMLFF